MRSDNMALYRDLTLYNFVYILLDYPTLFYDLLGEIRYDYSFDDLIGTNRYYYDYSYRGEIRYHKVQQRLCRRGLNIIWISTGKLCHRVSAPVIESRMGPRLNEST